MQLSPGTVEALITFLLGGGVITFATQLVRASRLWKTGRLATTREVIRDIAAARDEAEQREEEQRADAFYWSSIAAQYHFQLRQAGKRPEPPNPQPPSVDRRRRDRQRFRSDRERRAELAPTTEEIELAINGGEEEDPPRR